MKAAPDDGLEETRNLEIVLASRDLIGQAQGVLMERYKLSSDAAMDLLMNMAHEAGKRVAVIAGRIVDQSEESQALTPNRL